MRIYTRGGDKGKTGIHGGERVDKDDIRIEANGCLDELNSIIGVVRANLTDNHEWQPLLFKIQSEMMVVMSLVATPSEIIERNPNWLPDDLVLHIEQQIDGFAEQIQPNSFFILPGGNNVSAHLQLARTVARRAERRLWTLNKTDAVLPEILQYVNRLSDLFFTMARYEMEKQGKPEERWKLFMYKKKSL